MVANFVLGTAGRLEPVAVGSSHNPVHTVHTFCFCFFNNYHIISKIKVIKAADHVFGFLVIDYYASDAFFGSVNSL